jgi:hypothetical protein
MSVDESRLAEELVRTLQIDSYESTRRQFEDYLRTGVQGGDSFRDPDELNHWISKLNENDRKQIALLIAKAVEAAIFNTLVFLDGCDALVRIDDMPVIYTLTARVYEEFDDYIEGRTPLQEAAIAPQKGEDLHDIFLGMVRDGR